VIFECGRVKSYDSRQERMVSGLILMNENICQSRCITDERIGGVEQKATDKYVHEYRRQELHCKFLHRLTVPMRIFIVQIVVR